MIGSKKEAQAILRDALAAKLDDLMATSSFVRRANSLHYIRRCEDGKQSLRMYMPFKPSYQPGASAHIYPQVRLVFPELNQLALEMVSRNRRLIGDPEITVSEPMDFVIPKQHFLRWFTTVPETFAECVASIRQSVERWVIPFFDEYTTIESIASYYDTEDDRIREGRHFYIYVAAAYIFQGEPRKAKQVLEDKLGKAKSRREYAQAFEYVNGLCTA